ncbi:hypothetical protein VOLCADRAFT_92545 [Volvox carteri f. nagariensis]|uniref:Guanylate cyclase domain-containing protein n=1 Tax=Volvox carteri f. nagariensis TaxID=3068 RepID=D8TZY0_VOLCA|nr:uncharacterized protein VOLCADRAFT_92545 [Volvox carteri f. nagariensis]EFJ47008.1 hypothetical protein VOLCADRAFT_92545 [Volvox carteri f. nagariensis]|eukprot:XP_002951903.1 hypothetical protein VOLCADRAFT_92545 [Volvox carteri f. nagariensis]
MGIKYPSGDNNFPIPYPGLSIPYSMKARTSTRKQDAAKHPGFRSAIWTLQRLLSYSAPLSQTSVTTSDGVDAAAAPSSSTSARSSTCRRLSAAFAEGRSSWVSALTSALFRSGGGGAAAAGSVNVAPLVYANPVGGINAASPAASRAAAARLLSMLGSAPVQEILARDPTSGVTPFRRLDRMTTRTNESTAPLESTSPSSLQLLQQQQVSAVMVAPATQQDLDLADLTERLWDHPNAAPALRVPGAETLWPYFDAAIAELSPYNSPQLSLTPSTNLPYADDEPPETPAAAVTAALTLLSRKLPAALEAALPSPAQRRTEYRASLSYRQPVLTQRVVAQPSSSRLRVKLIVGLTLGLGGGAVLLAARVILQSRRTLRRLRGTSSGGDDSSNRRNTATYVVLDIQGLSEPSLPETVREQALRLCHDVVKQLARRYDGELVPLPHDEATPQLSASAAVRHGVGGDRLPESPAAALQAALAAAMRGSTADQAAAAVAAAAAAAGRNAGWRCATVPDAASDMYCPDGDGDDDGGSNGLIRTDVASANPALFLEQFKPATGKEHLSAGHLSDMLLPLPSSATITTKAAAGAAVAANAAAGGGPWATMSLNSEPHLPQSPFTVQYCTSSGEIPRPLQDSDGASLSGLPGQGLTLGGQVLGHQYLSGAWPSPSVLPTLPEGVTDSGMTTVDRAVVAAAAAVSGPRSGGGGAAATSGGVSDDLLAAMHAGRILPHAQSTPTTPLLGQLHALSPLRLRPMPYTTLAGASSQLSPAVPPAVAAAAAPSSQPLSSRGGGALAVAMAAARAAAGGASLASQRQLSTRLALIFASVHDAVCFCVHMQAMLTNCRWPSEVLELSSCQPIAVRPRAVSADVQQQACGAGGSPRADARKGGVDGVDGAAAAAGAMSTGVSGMAGCTDPGGDGVVMASTASSFITSATPSPFTPTGAVDRMKSLISGGAKGRSGRALRQGHLSPRLAVHGLGGGAAAAAAVPVATAAGLAAAPERSALSVSRFATASLGPGTSAGGCGTVARPFTSRSLMPYTSFGGSAHLGSDPWVVGGQISSAGCSRSGSTTVWRPPLLNGSFNSRGGSGGGRYTAAVPGGTAMMTSGLQYGGGGDFCPGSHIQPPRSALGRVSRSGGGGGGGGGGGVSPAYGSSLARVPHMGAVSQPLPKLNTVQFSPSFPEQASLCTATSTTAMRFPMPHGCGRTAAIQRSGCVVPDVATTAPPMATGGGARASSVLTSPPGIGGVSGIGGGTITAAAAAVAAGGGGGGAITGAAAALESGDSGLPGRIGGCSDRDTAMGIILGSLDYDTDGEAAGLQHVPSPPPYFTIASTAEGKDVDGGAAAMMTAYGGTGTTGDVSDRVVAAQVGSGGGGGDGGANCYPVQAASPAQLPGVTYDNVYDKAAGTSPTGGFQARRHSSYGDGSATSPAAPMPPMPQLFIIPAVRNMQQAMPTPEQVDAHAAMPPSWKSPPDTSSLRSAATPVTCEIGRTYPLYGAPATLKLNTDIDAPPLLSVPPFAAAATVVSDVNAGGGCDVGELSLSLAAGFRKVPTAEVLPLPPPPPAPPPAPSLAEMAEEMVVGSHGAWIHPPQPWYGRPVAECKEEISSSTNNLNPASTIGSALTATSLSGDCRTSRDVTRRAATAVLEAGDGSATGLGPSRMVGAVQDTMYDTAPVVSGGGGGHGLRNPVYDGTNANSLGSGGGQPSHVVVAAVAPPPLPPAAPPPSRRSVRSFGEQVRLTFEELMGVERSNLEDGVTVIFRGPRVVCGISTWQYGDEECTDMYGRRRTAIDSGDQHLYATQSNPLFYKTANGVLPALTPSYGGGTDITSDHVDDDVPNPEGAPATSVGGLGSGADDGGGGAPDDARVGVVRRRTTIMSPEARKYLRRRRMPAPLRRALAICESGQGGFVLLDGATYSASSQEALQEQCMILHMGEYVLAGVRRPLDLYLALDFAHLARVAYLRPLACAEQLSLGLPSAPVNTASICFSLVVGMQTLLAWNTEVAKAALAVLRDAVLPALLSHGGYLVEDADGLLLTAFSSSRSGLAWALECQEEAKHLDWPKELLGHDLGKELYMDDLDMEGKEEEEEDGDRESGNDILPVGLPPAPPVPHVNGGDGGDGSTAAAAAAAPYPRRHLVFRGLRIKSGLDCGDVLARVHATTGRMTYRGRVMNRAARIAGMATGGQVLCSRGLWDSSGLAAAPDLCQQALAVGASLGDVQLKGLSTKMEIIIIPVAHEDVVLENSIGPIGTAPFQFHQKPGMQEQQHQQQEQDEDAEDNGADVDVEARDGADAIPPKPGMAPNCAVRTVPSGGGNYPGTATATAAPCPLDGGGSTPTGAYPGSLASAVPALSEYDSDGSGKECAGGSGGGSIRIGPGAAAGESSAAVVAAAAAVESATAGSVAPAAAVVTAAAESVPYVSKALAVARMRHASQLRLNRCVHGSGGGIRGGSGAVQAAVLAAQDEDDDMADRLVAGYSSDGSGVDSGDGGPGSGSDGGSAAEPDRVRVVVNGTSGGVAALHGMLRRQRPAGSTTTAGLSSAASGGAGQGNAAGAAVLSAAATAAAAGGGSGGTARGGHLAMAAAANFKKAFRVVKRSILEEPDGGGLASASTAGGYGSDRSSDGDGGTGAGVSGGVEATKLRRPPPRRASELVKSSAAAVTAAAGAGGARLFNRLRGLAVVRGGGGINLRGRGGGEALSRFDELEEDDESRFRPTSSATSAFFPSLSRPRLRDGSGGGLSYTTTERSSSCNPSPLHLVSVAGQASRTVAGGGGGGTGSGDATAAGGSGVFARASSRLGGNSLVAEMSLASMTMRRQMPVSRFLKSSASSGGGGGGGGGSGVGGMGTALPPTSPVTLLSTLPMTSSSASTPGEAAAAAQSMSPKQRGPPQLYGRPRSNSGEGARIFRVGGVGTGGEATTYGIQEADGEEEESELEGAEAAGTGDDTVKISTAGSFTAEAETEATAPGWASTLRRGSETRSFHVSPLRGGGGSASAIGTVPSLPFRLASFTSSFLQRAVSRKLSPTAAAASAAAVIAPGEDVVRPYSGSTVAGTVSPAGVALDGGAQRSVSFLRARGGGGSSIGDGKQGSGDGSVSPPPPPPLQPASAQLAVMDDSRNGGTAVHMPTAAAAAAAMSPPTQTTATHLSRVDSLRRNSSKESSATVHTAIHEVLQIRPSDGLYGHVFPSPTATTSAVSPSGTASLSGPPPPPSFQPVRLGRSATGLGFGAATEAAGKSVNGQEHRSTSAGQEGQGGVASPPVSAASRYGNPLTSALEATPPSPRCDGSTPPLEPHMSIYTGDGDGGGDSGISNYGVYGGSSARMHQQTVVNAGVVANPADTHAVGRRRAVSHYLMDESVDGGGADGGGLGSPANAAAAAPPTGQRSQRRRSVIEVSGNVLFLNARSSYADSGWQLPAESETYGCGGSSTMLADQSCDGGAGDAVEPDAMYDVYEFADLLHHDVYSGQLAAAAKASPPSPPPPLSLAAAVPSAPRRRRSRRSTNLLAGVGSGSGGGNGGGGGETNLRTDVGSRPYSQFRQLSSSFKGGSHDVGGSNSQQRRSQPVMHSPRPLAHFAAVTAAAATAGDDSGIGNGNGSGSGAAFGQVQRSNTSAAHDLEPGGAVSGLGRLVRGLNGLIGRANSTTCNGGRRHLSGGSRQVFGSQRRGSVNAASGVMRSSGSATVDLYCDRGSSGDDRLERGTVVVAATAAAAAATDCGGGSASGEPTTATASGRRLVPELARSARELVSRVWSMRSTHSIGNESDGGGGGGGGSVSAGATSSSGGVRRDVAVSPELTAAATAAMPQLACGSLAAEAALAAVMRTIKQER